MALPSDPSLILSDPAPLNPLTTFPFRIDEFPADRILGLLFGHPPKSDPIADRPPLTETRKEL